MAKAMDNLPALVLVPRDGMWYIAVQSVTAIVTMTCTTNVTRIASVNVVAADKFATIRRSARQVFAREVRLPQLHPVQDHRPQDVLNEQRR
jgi:hypothetical protein